jgi:putative transposase
MASKARVVAPGVPHHITQRGNNRQKVYLSNEDRHIALSRRNRGASPQACSGDLQVTGNEQSANNQRHRRYRRGGHLWQNRFYSCAADRVHLLLALAYVDQNPLRAAMVNRATDYAWSSAQAHVRREDPRGLPDLAILGEIDRAKEWADVLEVVADNEQVAALRNSTNTGRPWGEQEFLLQPSSETGRDLAGPRRPRGRPPKAAAATA